MGSKDTGKPIPQASSNDKYVVAESAGVTQVVRKPKEEDALIVLSKKPKKKIRRTRPKKKVVVRAEPKPKEFKVEVIKGIERKSSRFCGPDKSCPEDREEEGGRAPKPKTTPKG